MYYVYVLISLKDQQQYVGFTRDLKRRCREHTLGKNKSTAFRRPLKLIYYDAHSNKHDALRRERYLKTNKGKTTLRLMLKEALGSSDS